MLLLVYYKHNYDYIIFLTTICILGLIQEMGLSNTLPPLKVEKLNVCCSMILLFVSFSKWISRTYTTSLF